MNGNRTTPPATLRFIPAGLVALLPRLRRTRAGLIALIICIPLPLQAQRASREAQIAASVARHETAILEARHTIHANPELGNREFETAALVAEHLQGLGLEVRTGVAHTGVIALLRGGRPGPVVAVRADMDALPVTEQTDLPFASTKRTVYNGLEVGVMHACGHDIHTSVQLGVASVLTDLRDEIPGTVLFIFQPAEEGAPPGEEGGAELILAEGIFEEYGPQAVFGLHITPDLPVGTVGYAAGPALAAVDHFWITVTGRQSHGAAPHQGVDPIVTASQVVLALQTITSRTLDPLQPCVVTVGMIHGGERFNIIPEAVRLEGTVRTYDPDVRETAERRMNEITAGVTAAAGARYELLYERGSPATINDPGLAEQMVPTARQILGAGRVIEGPPVMAGEDFAFYALEVPGFFYWLGAHREDTVTGPLHSPTLRADDSAIAVGMRVMSNLLIDYLELHR